MGSSRLVQADAMAKMRALDKLLKDALCVSLKQIRFVSLFISAAHFCYTLLLHTHMHFPTSRKLRSHIYLPNACTGSLPTENPRGT